MSEGQWVDLLPRAENDLNWVCLRGKPHRSPGGGLEVEAGPEGHLLFSRVRLGSAFEVRGEFEVVRSSSTNFQAGLALGVPNLETRDWQSFRLKRNSEEGDVATVAWGWTRAHLSRPVKLRADRNEFGAVY